MKLTIRTRIDEIVSFNQVIKSDEVRIHPMVRQMISAEMLKDIGRKSADVDEVGDV
ncbi:MAG: hypothetical protein OCD03_16330 [Hyphomicrobiales bacterium]